MVVKLPSQIPCAARQSYPITVDPATVRQERLMGRPRYELKQRSPSYQVDITWEMTPTQFSSWQTFWISLRGGADWFNMDLLVNGVSTNCNVHAMSPYSANTTIHQTTVKIKLEARPT